MPGETVALAVRAAGVTAAATVTVVEPDDRSEDGGGGGGGGGGGSGVGFSGNGNSGLRLALADAERRRAGRQELTGDLMQDRTKLAACGAILLLHSAVLVALDVVMLRRQCSGLLGSAFAVLATSLSAMVSGMLLAVQRAFSQRAVAAVGSLWVANIVADVCWLGLTLSQLNTECLGTAMIGATAVGLVSCPASLVAFVILFCWFGRSKDVG